MPNLWKFSLLLFFAAAIACNKEDDPINQPPTNLDEFDSKVAKHLKINRLPSDYKVSPPEYFIEHLPTFQPKNEVAQLGRVIFFDKNLSKDKQVSCGSCHLPERAFSDVEALSTGIFGAKTKRNSLAIGSVPWFGGHLGLDSTGKSLHTLFWDARAISVAEQSQGAFTNPVEMGMTMAEVVTEIKTGEFYNWLFKQAFGDSLVTEDRVFTALNHFMAGIGSWNSKFDAGYLAVGKNVEVDFPNFNASENLGKTLYLDHCESCHGSLNSPTHIFEANNGLEKPYVDLGKGAISGLFYENGTFKVPGLRNIAVTAPYMHDGRFANLEAVVEHYNSGVQRVFGLHGDLLMPDTIPGNYLPIRLNLTLDEKTALKNFLETLTDEQFLKAERFSNPFRQ